MSRSVPRESFSYFTLDLVVTGFDLEVDQLLLLLIDVFKDFGSETFETLIFELEFSCFEEYLSFRGGFLIFLTSFSLDFESCLLKAFELLRSFFFNLILS